MLDDYEICPDCGMTTVHTVECLCNWSDEAAAAGIPRPDLPLMEPQELEPCSWDAPDPLRRSAGDHRRVLQMTSRPDSRPPMVTLALEYLRMELRGMDKHYVKFEDLHECCDPNVLVYEAYERAATLLGWPDQSWNYELWACNEIANAYRESWVDVREV